MKLPALERLLFVTGFVLTAGICLGFLFGYRYSFDLHRVEQRGVLALSGVMDDVHVKIDTEEKIVSLPYVDANVSLGRHHVKVSKPGYLAFEEDIDVNTEEAIIVPLELAPQLLTGQTKVFPTAKNHTARYFSGLGVVAYGSASGTLLLHAEEPKPTSIFLPSSLRQGRPPADMPMQRVNDTQLLVGTGSSMMLYDETKQTWRGIRPAAKEQVVVDQGTLLAYAPEAGTVRYINAETGKIDATPFLEGIKEVTPSRITDVHTGERALLYHMTEGRTVRLQPRWFSFPAVEALSGDDLLRVNNTALHLTSTGALLLQDRTKILEGIEQVFIQKDTVIALNKEHSAFQIRDDGSSEFLTRFSSHIIALQPEPHDLYAFVQTTNALYFCERKTLNRCTELMAAPQSMAWGVDPHTKYIWYSEGKTVTLVPFFQEL